MFPYVPTTGLVAFAGGLNRTFLECDQCGRKEKKRAVGIRQASIHVRDKKRNLTWMVGTIRGMGRRTERNGPSKTLKRKH